MIYIVNLLLIFGLLYWGYKRTLNSKLAIFYWPALILKLIAGLIAGIIYSIYYSGGDTFSFFEAAIQIKNVGFSSWENFTDIYLKNHYTAIPTFYYKWIPSAFFTKLLAILCLLTGSSYWITTIYLSLFSFFGFWRFAESLYSMSKDKTMVAIAAFFFPSLVFWTSGIMKEAIAIGALAWLAAIFIELYLTRKTSFKKIMAATILLLVVAILKYYLAAMFIATGVTVFTTRYMLSKASVWYIEMLLSLLIFGVFGGLVSLLHPNLWPSRIVEVIFNNYQAYEAISKLDNFISFEYLGNDLKSLMYSSPKAIIAGLFYPLWSNEFYSLKTLIVIENWVLLLLSINAIINIKHSTNRDLRLIVWTTLIFILCSAILITLSTPNLGTLSRYKTGYLLFYLPIILPATVSRIQVILEKA